MKRFRFGFALLALAFGASVWHVLQRSRPAASAEVEISIGHWLLQAGMREAFDAAIAGYEKTHPHVRIRQIPVPVRSYAAWSRTQLVGGTAPDITGMLTLNEELISRYYLPLSPWLDRPNPYNAGTDLAGVPWRDTFVDGLSAMRNLTPTSGEICGVTLQVNSLRLFYNRDLLREITGADRPPADFAALQALGRQVAAYGARTGRRIVPIAGCGPYVRQLFNVLLPSQTQRLTLTLSPYRNLRVTSLELAALMLDGKVSYRTPELRRSLELMHDASLLLTPGFSQQQRDDAIAAYLRGEALMFFAGSWDYATLVEGAAFPTGMVPLPLPAADDPRYGPFTLGPPSEAAGYPEAMLGVMRSSRHPEVALDFLRYLTSRPVAAEFSRTSRRISAIRGTPPPFDAAELRPRLAGEIGGFTVDFGWFGADYTSNYVQRHIHEALGPRGDVAAFADELDAGVPPHLREDIAWLVTRLRRDARNLDALVAFRYLLPEGDPARAAWTRDAEMQHVRQLDVLQYAPYGEP